MTIKKHIHGGETMQVITFSSLKGGVGKSSATIQVANCLGKAGKKVLVIDMDLNNSVTSYYLNDETKLGIDDKNIANALSKTTNNLNDYIILTDRERVDLIPSSLYLVDLRGLSEKRLSQLIKTVDNYDYVIIDTQPTYDNLVLNAYYASDFIITPIYLSLFDYNTALFLSDKLKMETGKFDNWFLHINGFNHRFEDSKTGSQKEYLDVFKNEFKNLTPIESWFPWTSTMRQIIDRNLFLSEEEQKSGNSICNPSLFNSVCALADCFLEDGETLQKMEMF